MLDRRDFGRSMFAGALMVATGGAAEFLRPKASSVIGTIPDLDLIIPKRFGKWQIDSSIVPIALAPDAAQFISQIYDRTVARTYVDDQDRRVMMSLAYGANQSKALQLHRPEVCYVAQGFRVRDVRSARLEVPEVTIPVMQMVAEMGRRIEPITYWIRIGDDMARGWYEQRKARFKYGLKGQIPDGLLFRLSSISSDVLESFELHRRFVADMVGALPRSQYAVFFGKPETA